MIRREYVVSALGSKKMYPFQAMEIRARNFEHGFCMYVSNCDVFSTQ
jgi:hypothetical protein